jgi:CRP-like cAMP-binding protein
MELSDAELALVRARAAPRRFPAGEMVFVAGEPADAIYFIESGHVSIVIEKFNTREEVQILGPGELFGEMAVLGNNQRTASAAARDDVLLLCISKSAFLEFLRAEPGIGEKIHTLLARRNEELALKEKLIDATGLSACHLHIGIKGDPTLRESALFRDRHDSPVDKAMPELVALFQDLLLNRCAYRIHVGFNSGEIRVSTIIDPFNEEFHPASRLLDAAYVDRHFPRIDYERKAAVVRRVFGALREDAFFTALPAHLGSIFDRHYDTWEPMPKEAVASTIAKFPELRDIPNYYVRNATISIIKDAIHMQFNCDGAHIVSAADYERFLQENL